MKEKELKMVDVISDYKNGTINKQMYIEDMYNSHKKLIEYSDLIRNTDIEKIEISSGNVVMTDKNNEVKLICTHNDMRSIPLEIINFSNYEREILFIMKCLISENDSIFDIGANIGWYSMNLMKIFSNCTIYSFEPLNKTFKILEKNFEINNLKKDNLFNIGFSEENGESKFYCASGELVSASLKNIKESDDVEVINCTIRKLDDFVTATNSKVDVIKCDVEGAELLVLKGGYETLKRDTPIIFIEMLRKWSAQFNYHPNDIIDMLFEIGYRCFAIENFKLIEIFTVNDDTVHTNFIFLHSEKHKDKIKSAIIK